MKDRRAVKFELVLRNNGGKKMEATNKSRHGGVWNSQTPEHIAKTKQHFRELVDTFEKENK